MSLRKGKVYTQAQRQTAEGSRSGDVWGKRALQASISEGSPLLEALGTANA